MFSAQKESHFSPGVVGHLFFFVFCARSYYRRYVSYVFSFAWVLAVFFVPKSFLLKFFSLVSKYDCVNRFPFRLFAACPNISLSILSNLCLRFGFEHPQTSILLASRSVVYLFCFVLFCVLRPFLRTGGVGRDAGSPPAPANMSLVDFCRSSPATTLMSQTFH